ncbi:MAG: DUF3467 domain-containing protein [Mariprofundaceae bacterium]|nr:DUF3467 domain-containing protein [Mariprofundaceae bacterium]
MSNSDRQKPKEIQIQIPTEIQGGVYANNMVVVHTQEEFVLDFIMVTPPVGTVNARVVVSPSHARRIAAALVDNVAKYEERFGEIKDVPAAMPEGAVSH